MTTTTRTRNLPNTLEVLVAGLGEQAAHRLAILAVSRAQHIAPKSSGRGSQNLRPYWGKGFFGITWTDSYMWYQEAGIKAFTMRSLAGKLIPMWVNDRDGSEAAKIPIKDRTRRTRTDAAGKRQVLIFRKVSAMGARKQVPTSTPGLMRSAPASYPGAPGRISHRVVENGRNTGRIAARVNGLPHVGVRWRFPGLIGRGFMHHALQDTALSAGLGIPDITAMHRRV